MVSRTPAQNATATAVRTGRTLINRVRVAQRASGAPVLYLQIFNTNAPTVGTTAPVEVIQVPAGNANLDQNYCTVTYSGALGGLDLGTGFAYACTTVHDGAVAPTAGQEPLVEIEYEAVG